MKLNSMTADERAVAVSVGAAVALHGLLAGGASIATANDKVLLVGHAFDLSEAFIAEALRRYAP